MAGTINLALSQQFDMDGEPLGGGLLYFFAAGTTTPQSAFQDTGLTIVHPNPIVLDASGRVPMFYLADGNIKIRLTDDSGVIVIAADNLLVIGPSSGGGGGGGVDPNTVLQTGDIKTRFDTNPLAGFVRCNGNTIGNSVSGASERANADCQALFEFLWSTTVLGIFAGLTPSRGATANADWLANKRCALPDLRGRVIAGMDDMGTTAASRLTSTFFGASGIVLGNAGGGESQTLSTTQIPSHLHAVASQHFSGNLSIGSEDADHVHSWGGTFTSGGVNSSLDHTHQYGSNQLGGVTGGGAAIGPGATQTTSGSSLGGMDHTHNVSVGGNTGGRQTAHAHAISGNTQLAGGGTAHSSTQPTMVMTVYIKL